MKDYMTFSAIFSNRTMSEIIHGLSNADYHDRNGKYGDYISSSLLKLYAKSPAAYKYALDHPQEETDAMKFGSLFHDLMASCAEHYDNGTAAFGRWYEGIAMFDPPINAKTGQSYGATTKVYAEAYKQFLADNTGKTVASKADVDLAVAMSRSLLIDCGSTSEQVCKLLKWGKPEVSIFHETEDGVKIKIRPDLLLDGIIVDWKSVNTDDLSEDSLNRIILKYGYHISAAQYQWVAHEVLGKWLDFYLVFVSKAPPYDCVMVDMKMYGYQYLPDEDYVIPHCGALEFKRLLDTHTKFTKDNHWPGAETFISGDKYKILEIKPPRYYANQFEEIIY